MPNGGYSVFITASNQLKCKITCIKTAVSVTGRYPGDKIFNGLFVAAITARWHTNGYKNG